MRDMLARGLLFILLAISLAGCFSMSTRQKENLSQAQLEYQNIYDQIIGPKCAGCHGTDGGVTLYSYQQVLSYVVPHRPELSLLYEVMADGRMPKDGPPLDPAELDLVEKWIANGAGQ
jgi:mono/diheme cytochrome c family protein